MGQIGEYIIRESLSEDVHFKLCRGWHERNQQKVLLKWTKAPYPDLKEIARLKNEHDFTYRVIGDGPLRYGLESLAKQLGLSDRVSFLGFVDEQVLKREMSTSDLFILISSLSEKSVEGFGLVYLEANACGVPVVAARLGGAIDAVDEGVSGVFVDKPVPEQVAEVLQKVFAKDIVFSASECRKHATKFSWDRVVDHIVGCYV